jgi:hypothetical protein
VPGGQLDELGVHYLDVPQFLVGPARRVTGLVTPPSPGPPPGNRRREGGDHTARPGLSFRGRRRTNPSDSRHSGADRGIYRRPLPDWSKRPTTRGPGLVADGQVCGTPHTTGPPSPRRRTL